MTDDSEHEIKKATDTLVRLLKESGDKTQAIANYYASVAYWESKGRSAPELPDAAIEVMNAEEAKAFMEHRKKYAANKAAEQKKKEDAYWSKFFWALGLVFVIYFPAYWSHVDNLTNARKVRAQEFIVRHMQGITGVIGTSKFPQSYMVENDYSRAFKQESILEAKKRLNGLKVKFDSLDPRDAGFPGTAGSVITLQLPLEGGEGVLEYTVEDTSHGKNEPVITATNELDVPLPERTEEAQQSAEPQLSLAEYQRKMAENTARKAVSKFIRAAATSDSATYNSMVLGKCDVNPPDYIELWQSPILNADTKLNENMNECVIWLTFNRSSLPNRAKFLLESQAGRWWIADIQVPDSKNQQQGYNSQQQYQAPQEDPSDRRRREAEEYERKMKKQWQQENAKDDSMQPSLGGDQDPGFEQ